MIIAHVLSSFRIGGQERVALDLARGQRARGHEVLAICLDPGPDAPLAEAFAAHGVATHTVDKSPGVDITLPLRLARLLGRRGVQIVHTHNPQPLLYGAPAARLVGAAIVHTKHGANPERGRRLLARRAAGRLVDALVAVSSTTAVIASRNDECPRGRLHVIDNGIDLARFHADAQGRADIRASLGIPADAWVIGTVGRLAPEKAYPALVEAAAPLLGEQTRLVIVGEGSERGPIEATAARLGVSALVHLAGARSDVPRILAALDVFALSSTTEGLPLVIPEAMATGLPVVSTSVGGIPGVVREGETGLLVPAGDTAALTSALDAMARDPARARALGARGRALALACYSAERMVDDYLALYASVIPRGIRRALAWAP
jgi:glycosyltransferase involved in cell wall biosynthesis